MTGETARAEDEAAGQPDTPAAATGAPPAGDPKPSTSLDRELAEMKDRLLRTLAEMENLRKRTEREVIDSRLYGVASFARDVLGVIGPTRLNYARVIPMVDYTAKVVSKLLGG